MVVVTTTDGRQLFPTVTRFFTEEIFNNLCLHDDDDNLVAVFSQDKWISVEVEHARRAPKP